MAHNGVRAGAMFTPVGSSRAFGLDALGNARLIDTDAGLDGNDEVVFNRLESRAHDDANELLSRDLEDDSTDDFTLTYDDAGNLRTKTRHLPTGDQIISCLRRRIAPFQPNRQDEIPPCDLALSPLPSIL